MNEIFGFHRKLVRLRHMFFREEERAMVHVVPWVFRGVQRFKDLLIIVEATSDRSDGPSVMVEIRGSMELDII